MCRGDARGMRIDITGGLDDMPRIEQVVRLGVALAGRYRDHLAQRQRQGLGA